MKTIEKFQKMIKEEVFENKLKEKTKFYKVYVNAITELLDLEKTFYSRVSFEKILSFLDILAFSHDERTEIIAFYISKCLKVFEASDENEKLYLDNVIGSTKTRYDFLCQNLMKLRESISRDGDILPFNSPVGIHDVRVFQFYVPIEDQYIKDILNLCKKRYIIEEKKIKKIRKATYEITLFLEKLNNCYFIINSSEIETVKKNMELLGFSDQRKQEILEKIAKINNFLINASSKKELDEEVDYKTKKKLTFELSQYINLKSNMPYDYMTEDEITEVCNILNLLNYSLETIHIILNNIKKKNAQVDNKCYETELYLLKQDIFAKIDSDNNKLFETPANEIYLNAINNETMLEDKNEKINKALTDIDEAINNIVNASNEEDKNIWIGYIMELLNDIDKEFSQALEWKLIRTRNCVKNNKTRIG